MSALGPLPAADAAARGAAFEARVAQVQGCRRCPRMEGRTRVLGDANGARTARVMFVGEAPGRLGGDRTAVPFGGDQSGATFERLLAAAGWTREEVFVTNAVLCNPRDPAGRNARPATAEIAACREHLAAQITLIDPVWVVALGHTALRALAGIERHGLRLAADVGRAVWWHERRLVALYHPGPRALIRRPLAQQLDDYRALAALVRAQAAASDCGG